MKGKKKSSEMLSALWREITKGISEISKDNNKEKRRNNKGNKKKKRSYKGNEGKKKCNNKEKRKSNKGNKGQYRLRDKDIYKRKPKYFCKGQYTGKLRSKNKKIVLDSTKDILDNNNLIHKKKNMFMMTKEKTGQIMVIFIQQSQNTSLVNKRIINLGGIKIWKMKEVKRRMRTLIQKTSTSIQNI